MANILPAEVSGRKPKLLDQVRDVIRRKHFSIRTEKPLFDKTWKLGDIEEVK